MTDGQRLTEQFGKLRGLCATVVTTGSVEALFAQCHEDLRSFNDRNGLHSIEYKQFYAALVEAGRDAVVAHALANQYDFLVMIDADATFAPDALYKILDTAYNAVPDSDAVGAYCQLKGAMTPTLDTGSGTWEIHYPGEGVIPVIRTGAHFILCKASAFQKMGPAPWFRTRHAPRALDVLAEMDGMSRQAFSGSNPFSSMQEWKKLLEAAAKNSQGGPSSVGEDSGFCDRLLASGGRIYVNCDIVTGHIYKDVITPRKLKERVDKHERAVRLHVGVLE
jgi:hypothetical protein